MPLRLLALPVAILATVSVIQAQQPVQQQAQPPAASSPLTIACSGPFAKDSSHARLQQTFGTQVVAAIQIDGAEGRTFEAP